MTHDWEDLYGVNPWELRDRLQAAFERVVIDPGHLVAYFENIMLVRQGRGRKFSISAYVILEPSTKYKTAFSMDWDVNGATPTSHSVDLIKEHLLPALQRLFVLDDMANL